MNLRDLVEQATHACPVMRDDSGAEWIRFRDFLAALDALAAERRHRRLQTMRGKKP